MSFMKTHECGYGNLSSSTPQAFNRVLLRVSRDSKGKVPLLVSATTYVKLF